jgi:hypothetical protein
MKRYLLVAGALALTFVNSPIVFAQSITQNGTWKHSIEKSKYDPGPQPKNPQVRTLEAFGGDGQKYRVEGIAGNGNKTLWTYTASYDGKDCPISGPAPFGATTVVIKRLGPNKTQELLRNGDKVVEATISELSMDGKTLRVTATGTNTSGAVFTNILVFDRAD